MRTYKRIFALLVAFCMGLSVLPSLALTVRADVEQGEIVVNYDPYPFYEEDLDDVVDHTSVYVDGEYAANGEPFGFVVGREMQFDLNTYRDYDIEYCNVVIYQGENEYSTYNNDFEIEGEGDHGSFIFNPQSSESIEVYVYWCEVDTLSAEAGQILFDIYQGGPGDIEFLEGVEPLDIKYAPNGTIRALFNRSQFGNGDALNIKFTPYRGCILCYFSETLDDNSVEYFPNFENNSPEPVYYCEHLTDNGDGSYTFSIDSFEPYTNDSSFMALSVFFEGTFGRQGISVENRDTTVYYSIDGGKFTELKMRHFEDEWNSWDEMILEAEEINDASEITFRFEVPENQAEWRKLYGVCVESFDRLFERHTYAFDDGDSYEITLETPEEGWPATRIAVCDWLIPYDGTYAIYVRGEGSEELDIENDALYEPVPFEIGEPIEFSFEGDVYCVIAREYNNSSEFFLDPEDGIYSFTPENSNGIEIYIYMTEDEYIVDHMHPEKDDEYELEFRVNNENFPEENTLGSVELVEDEHIVRWAESCGRYKLIVQWDRGELEEQEDPEAIINLKVNVPEDSEFSVWMNGQDFTEDVIENDNIFSWDITNRILYGEWMNTDFNFRYNPYGPYILAVNYDNCFYRDNDEGEPYAHADVLVNGVHVNDFEPVPFEIGKPITFKICVPDGYDYSDALIDLHHGKGDLEGEVHYTTFEYEDAVPITVDSKGEFTFTPTREDTIWVDISWSAFDSLHPEEDQLQIEFGHWGNGTIEFVEGYEPAACEVQPGENGRIRTLFNKEDLDENGTVKMLITPDAGNKLCSFGYDINGSPFTEYVSDPDDEHQLLLKDLTGLVDNGDGTYTYTISSIPANEYGNSRFSFNVGFDNPIGTNGISVDPRGADVFYSIDGGQFIKLETRHFKDDWNEWDEVILLPEEYYDASTVAFKFVYEEDRDVSGVSLEYYSDARHRSNLPFDDETEHIFTMNKPERGWQPYRLSLLEGYNPYDGTCVIYVQGDGSDTVNIEGAPRNERFDVAPGTNIAFTVEGDIFGVYVRLVDTDEEFELKPNNSACSYTVDGNGAVEIHVYTTYDEFDFHHTHPDGENEYEVDFWIRYEGSPVDDDLGSVEVIENEHLKKVATTGGNYRVIVEYDRNDPDFDVALLDLKINVPENAEFSMWMNDEDITESVIDNDYVYSWDITNVITGGDWRSPDIVFYFPEPEYIYLNNLNENVSVGFSTDGGNTFVAADDEYILLDNSVETVQVRYLVSDPNLWIYGVDLRFGDQVIIERLPESLTYEFERGDHWITYHLAPVYENRIFDCEWTARFAMQEDADIVTLSNGEIMGSLNRFGRGDTITIEAEGVYCIEAELNDGRVIPFEKNGDVFTYYAEELSGFTAVIYSSEDEYNFLDLWPDPEAEGQYLVQYYSESESEETGTVSVAGEIDRASYNGWTRVLFESEKPIAEFEIEPASNEYEYYAMLNNEEFEGTLDVSEWRDDWPVIEFYHKIDISGAAITLDPSGDQAYTGSEIKPKVTVVVDGITLEEGIDYEVFYADNVEAGQARIRVDGIGSYYGNAYASFNIVKSTFKVTVKDAENGTVTVSKLDASEGDEITITAAPAEGYEVDAIKVDGTVITGTSFVMPAKDVTVEVVFKAVEPVKNGWVLENGKYYYYDNGTMKTGWVQSGSFWYYMNPSDGTMVTGWQSIGGKWYYFEGSGAMSTGWKSVGGIWYYFGTSGAMATGWQEIGGKWYYFETSGAMASGWKQSGGKWYLFDSSGVMVTGWKQEGSVWYLFDDSGAMVTGWKQSGGKWYYFEGSGAMATGWKQLGGVWYYFGTSGAMATGWQTIGGKWYYFEGSGAMATGWKQLGGKWYYFYDSGAMASNTVIDGWTLGSDGAWTGK
ncbi:MAG: hypothetical protein K5665_00800 [Saccharofermentans sp.]|nr:hypothetical protein [Saccharofermentans sp.]